MGQEHTGHLCTRFKVSLKYRPEPFSHPDGLFEVKYDGYTPRLAPVDFLWERPSLNVGSYIATVYRPGKDSQNAIERARIAHSRAAELMERSECLMEKLLSVDGRKTRSPNPFRQTQDFAAPFRGGAD